MRQVLPEGIVLPQVLETTKSEVLLPETVIPETLRNEVPLFVTVTVLVTLVATVWLSKVSDVGESVKAEEAEEPLASAVQVLAPVQPYKFDPAVADVLK